MERLKNKLSSVQKGEINLSDIYEGAMSVNDPPFMPETVYDSTYYNGDIGYTLSIGHKGLLDTPTVVISIPTEILFQKINSDRENDTLKRLKNYLLGMKAETTTYKEMYDGEMIAKLPPKSNGELLDDEIHNSSVYYGGDIGYDIAVGHRGVFDCPSVTVRIPCEKLDFGVESLCANEIFRTAAADYCLRAIKPYFDALNSELYNRARPDRESGRYYLRSPGGEVISRNASYFKVMPQKYYRNGGGNSVYVLPPEESPSPKLCLCIMLEIQLPCKKIRKTIQMLTRDLPYAVNNFVLNFDCAALYRAAELAAVQENIRAYLRETGKYCAFIADGSILPREKDGDFPLKDAIPFTSTPDDRITVCGVSGMGIKRGVTVITGGGYSGKSTLLDAVSAGIYNHFSGDGREFVITDCSGVKISAEDGRSVRNVNISPFIKWLPSGDTKDFSTAHASGSTSQAANIMEAVDNGASLLMIDEDRSATNFMIRDKMMKELIEKEPITPFTDRVNELYKQCGVSTILVIGGSGEYLSVADKIYMMEDYVIHDVTENARAICERGGVECSLPPYTDWNMKRILHSQGFTSYPEGCGTEKMEISDMGFILIGDERIDIRMLHNIVCAEQLNGIGFILRYLQVTNSDSRIDLSRRLDELYIAIATDSPDFVHTPFFSLCGRFIDMPRKCEVMAVVNRMRGIRFVKYSCYD